MISPTVKKLMLVVPVLAAVAGGAWWLAPQGVSAEKRYITAPLESGPITQTVSANGTLNPVKLVNVGSQVSGIVKKLYADFNDHVKAGQLLLELDPALTQAQMQQSDANVASAQAALELAQANEARTRGLFAQEYVTRQELDTAVQARKSAQAQLAVAQAQAGRDRTNLSYTVIRSPVAGVVVSREVDVGQSVAASLQAPTLFKIAQDLSRMQIDANYAEADVGSIRVGQPVTFRVDAFPNRMFRGEVYQIRLNPAVLQNVVTYDVVISVDNPGQVLLPGMTAYVNIMVAQNKEALLVPNAALRFRPADAVPGGQGARGGNKRPDGARDSQENVQTGTLYVLRDGKPAPVKVTLGITDNRMTEVRGGELKKGDLVIVEDSQPPAKEQGPRGMRLF